MWIVIFAGVLGLLIGLGKCVVWCALYLCGRLKPDRDTDSGFWEHI